jgi:hypothetical protein
MNYQFSEKDRLYLSGYFGRDVFDFRNARRSFSTDIPWGNSTATLRWNHVFNRKLFANTTLLYNDYKFAFNGAQDNFALNLSSGGHLSHGMKLNTSAIFYHPEHYELDPKSETIDFNSVRAKAKELKPRMILCGYSAYR